MTDQANTALADTPDQEPERVGRFTPPRQAVVDVLRRRLTDRLQDVEGGAWDGVRVVTAKDLDEALGTELPPASEFSAEIQTPGWVTVAAVCPRCGIANSIGLDVRAELLIESGGSAELRLKGKSKARTHVCGQTTLDAAETDQQSFDLSDIVGADHEATDDDGLHDEPASNAPVCECGQTKVESPDGRWVCTNPDHKPGKRG